MKSHRKRRKWKKILPVIMSSIMILTLLVIPKVVKAGTSNVTFVKGRKITYGSWSTNYFTINGNAAYCLEPAKPSPESGEKMAQVHESNTALITKGLYYLYGGPGFTNEVQNQIFQSATSEDEMYCYSHAILSFIFDDCSTDTDAFKGLNDAEKQGIIDITNWINAQEPAPNTKISFSSLSENAYYDASSGMQRTKDITFQSDPRNSVTVPLPNGVTLVNITKGTEHTSSAALNGNDKFYLKAKLSYDNGKTYTTGDLLGSDTQQWRALIIASQGGSQAIGGGQYYFDPTNTAKLDVKWVGPGQISIEKIDKENNTNTSQGSATLEGAIYEIYNSDNVLLDTITTDKDGKGISKLIPWDIDYAVKEKTASKGYLVDAEQKVLLNAANVVVTSKEQVMRGDLEFVKIEAGTGNRMADIPFSLTSTTTKESHSLVSDENGSVSTASSWNPHKQNTNKGETSSDGIWFGNMDAIDESKGALLYDTYILDELPCENNKGKVLLKGIQVTISKNNTVVKMGTLTNELEPVSAIKTKFFEVDTESKILEADGVKNLVDVIETENMDKEIEYEVTLKIMVKPTDDSEPQALVVDGKEVEATIKAKIDKSGDIRVPISIDTTGQGGKELVAYEEVKALTDPENPILVVEEKDINNKDQTIRIRKPVPAIKTRFFESDTESKTLEADGVKNLVDVIETENLDKDVEYEVTLKVMVKPTDDSEPQALVIDGKEVEATIKAKLDEKGEFRVPIAIDTTGQGGKELVAYEEVKALTDPDKLVLVAEEKDINNKNQTITIVAPEQLKEIDKPTTTVAAPKTGLKSKAGTFGIIGTLLLLLSLVSSAVYYFKKHKKEVVYKI